MKKIQKVIEDSEKQEFIPAKENYPLEGINTSSSPRRDKYKPEMCDVVIQVANDGGFHAAMMVALDIGNDTFYRWKREIPEFKEAVEKADLISLALQEAALMDGMLGKIKGYNFSANAMILNNKYKALYQRTDGGSTTDITINTINLTPEQLDTKIAQKLEKLKSMGIELKPNE